MAWRRRPRTRSYAWSEIIEGQSMSDDPDIQLLNHDLAEDELNWMRAVYQDFQEIRAISEKRKEAFDPKEALRQVLGLEQHGLPTPMDLSGPGPWRNGRNRHGRLVTAVFLPNVE